MNSGLASHLFFARCCRLPCLQQICTYRMEVRVEQSKVEKNMKEWRRPVLRKLPIAATANKVVGNEGAGGGKGDNAKIPS